MEAALPLLPLLAALNIATFLAFAWDKRCAREDRRRVPESVLLQLAFLGGSPAAKLAQRRLRHKTRKRPFATRLNAIVALHVTIISVVVVLAVFPEARLAVGLR
ncbi:MAG: DUF1294 domain-containing protein [Silicimonas sp.]|nr:DUF1294 domain-containing protein [Silicimonas sp.]NND41344.1 DUF1294 domain-containing protein [Silicimonas sp.]NNF92268.1 DUF1294 domain-containing protein [Boseongicola sp.]NNL72431.1 DUF1294 domain-containing protein [Silicimonas sp.]